MRKRRGATCTAPRGRVRRLEMADTSLTYREVPDRRRPVPPRSSSTSRAPPRSATAGGRREPPRGLEPAHPRLSLSAYPVGSRRPCLREPALERGRPPRRVRVHHLTWASSLTRLHPDARVRGGSRHEPGHAPHRTQGRL